MIPQPPTDDAPFTTGEFKAQKHRTGNYITRDGVPFADIGLSEETHEDCKLIASALNAATSLHRSGYDAQKVFEALAEIMSFVDALEEDVNHSAKRLLSLHYNLRRKQKP